MTGEHFVKRKDNISPVQPRQKTTEFNSQANHVNVFPITNNLNTLGEKKKTVCAGCSFSFVFIFKIRM